MEQMKKDWSGYLEYLKEWASYHESTFFCGCSPASFDEWLMNEDLREV